MKEPKFWTFPRDNEAYAQFHAERLAREGGHELDCPECNGAAVRISDGAVYTNVGYSSPPGHDHDDNCATRPVWCAKGHRWSIGLRRTCPACDWKGKAWCCYRGYALDAWPVLAQEKES